MNVSKGDFRPLKISPWNMTTFPVSEILAFASVGENNGGGFKSAMG